MRTSLVGAVRQALTVRFRPTRDLAAVAASWLLVVGAIYTATVIVRAEAGGGLPYFGLYAVLGATVFGVGIPVYWTVVVRRRPLDDLGLTRRRLGLSLMLQAFFAGLQFMATLARMELPPMSQLLPLVALALAIGFFEAVFWRGWVLLRLEDSFGTIPAVLLGSALYAAYHVGYAMPLSEMVFLFFVGIMFAVAFLLTRNVLILWPAFQPMGQLVTLIREGLQLPVMSSLGFIDVLVVMFVFVGLGVRYRRRHDVEALES